MSAVRGLRVIGSIVAGVLLISLLAAAGFGFVLKSLPYQTPQLPPPQVTLTALDASEFTHYPPDVRAVPVLAWRDVSNRPGNLVSTATRFATLLATMRRDGFQSVRLPTLETLARGGHVTLPSRPVVLTFDGGLATDWTTVDPILRRYGFSAIVFINPSDVATKSPSYFLTRDELHAMAGSGRWDIGAQIPIERRLLTVAPKGPSVSNGVHRAAAGPESVTEWRERAARDAAAAVSRLEGIVGHSVGAYAWPASELDNVNTREAPAVTYPALKHYFPVVFGRPGTGSAAFVVPGSAGTPLPRIRVTAADSLPTLSARLRSGIPGPPPSDPFVLAWRAGGGKCEVSGRTVTLTAHHYALCTPVANGSSWRNYALHLRVAAPAEVTAIIEVGVSKSGRLEVALGRGGLLIEQEVGSRWSVLRRVPNVLPPVLDGNSSTLLGGGPQAVTLSLAGRMLTVQIGSVSVHQQVSPTVGHGLFGVGLAATTRKCSVRFGQVSVSPVRAPATHGAASATRNGTQASGP